MASQISFANNDKPTTLKEVSKASKVYVVVKSATATQKFMDNYGSALTKELAERGIDADYAIDL